jgi:hypothetical protein
MTDEQNTEFETWWEKYGQYCRSGGGEYEKSFSYATWEHCTEQARSTIAAPAQHSDDATIDAAEALASLYDGDDRQDIKTDVMNAFYAGVKFAFAAPASTAAPVVPEGWSKVTADTPPVDEMVILAAEFDHPGDWRKKVGYRRAAGDWNIFGGSWMPTHWMPLPSDPKPDA